MSENLAKWGNTPALPQEALNLIIEIDAGKYDYAWKVWSSSKPVKELQAIRKRLEESRYEEKLAVAYAKAVTLPARRGGYTVREVNRFTGLSLDVIVAVRSKEDALFDGIEKADIEKVYAFANLPATMGAQMSREMIGVRDHLKTHRDRKLSVTNSAKVAAIVAWFRGMSQYEIARHSGITRLTLRRALGQS